MKFYQYPKCGTCKKAEKWLGAHEIAVDSIDIVEKPPSKSALKKYWKSLFQTTRNWWSHWVRVRFRARPICLDQKKTKMSKKAKSLMKVSLTLIF